MMDGLIYVIPIIAIAAMAVYLVIKIKNAGACYSEFHKDVIFSFTVVSDKTESGAINVCGLVENASIKVGDVFCIVDRENNVIDNNVKVESIDKGVINKKYVDEASDGETVTLALKTHTDDITDKMFLKNKK